MVIVINPKITISNRTAYTIVAIAILLGVAGIAYAINSGNPYIHGHDSSEIDMSYTTTSYNRNSQGDGTQTRNMGEHSFCTLSRVASGGFNSACSVYKEGDEWMLEAVDPVDAYPDTQRCGAICFDPA